MTSDEITLGLVFITLLGAWIVFWSVILIRHFKSKRLWNKFWLRCAKVCIRIAGNSDYDADMISVLDLPSDYD